ncbi:MAG: 23S rRNA (guanosine(2251)-2'-O)-methyltransferase RlmB [Burkholderiales bacterium]
MSADRVIHGFHAVTAALRSGAIVHELYLDAARADVRMQDLVAAAKAKGVRVMTVDAARLDGLTGRARHQGVAARVAAARAQSLDDVLEAVTGDPLVLVLDGITDPHNLGACLRVADAAGVHAVVAPKDHAVGINATVSKVASGAAETVPYCMVTNLARTLRELKERGLWIVGADEAGPQTLHAAKLSGPLAWVLGAEGEGMRRLTREHCDLLVRIPMAGAVESLNVSVAAGVCLFETVRQRRDTPAKIR